MAPRPGRSSIGVRVRPNANDFIVDLERQLSQKKKTFYVDVHANLKPANKDVAEWTRVQLKKVRAVVPVSANLIQATVDVADWRRKQRGIKTKIPVEANMGKAYAQVMTFRKIAGKDIEVNLVVNTQSADKAADRFAQAMARRGVRVPVDVDVDRDAVARTAKKIDTDLIQRLQSQGGVILDVDAKTAGAQAKLDRFASKKVTVQSQLDLDMKKANYELKLLKIRAAKEKLELNVSVNRSAIERVHDSLKGIEKQFGNLTVLRSLDLGPLTLGKPTGLIGTLSTVTLLAGAVPGAVAAVTSLSKVLIDLAGAAAIVPGAIGGILASIATFTVGTQGVGDTLGALFDVWNEGASSQASTAKAATRAQDQLTNAVKDEADAQRDVASARRDATNDLRNLNNELRGSVLNEAQAILDVQKARDRLAKGGFDTITDMKQAQLDVAKADQSLVEVREKNAQLQVKANDESSKGVEGSDRVQQALDRQTRAAQATQQAMEAIASSAATGTLGKFNDLLAQLSPNAQAFVQVIAGAKGQLQGFKTEIQDIIFQGLAPALQGAITNLLPTIGPGMKAIATGINQNILAVFNTLQTPEGKSIIERILGGTAEAQKALSRLVNPLVRGLGTLMAAGAEHLPQVVDLITRLADRFATFVTSDPKALDDFMDRGIKALGQIAEIGINAIKIVNDLSNAFDGDLLQTIEDLTDKLHTFLTSDEGKQKLKDWIKEAGDLWNDWKPVLKDLPGILDAVSKAAKGVVDVLLPFLHVFTSAMERWPGLVTGFIGAWLGVKVLTGIGGPIFRLAEMITTIGTKVGKLPGLIKTAIDKMRGLQVPSAPTGPLSGPAGTVGAATPGKGGKGGLASRVAPVLGSAGVAAAGTLAVTDILQRVSFASDAEGKYNAWKEGRGQAASEEDKRALDKAVYASIGVDIGDETIYPLPSPAAFKGMYQGYDSGQGPQFRAHDGKIWFGDKPVSDSWGQVSFGTGGYTDWAQTVGRTALLHGGEYVEPHDTVDHYGVGAMKAIHEKRVPKELLRSFEFGGFNWPFPMAPQDPNMPLPDVPHGPPPGMGPTNPTAVPGQSFTGPAPGPVGDVATNSLANTPVGPMASDQTKSRFNIFGMDIPIPGGGSGSDPTKGILGTDFSDPNIWPFGIPGVGAPGTTKDDAGKWLADWGAKTIGGLGEALVSGVLGFFGAEGILNSPYFNALRTTLGYYSNLPGAVSNTAPGAADTAAAVDADINAYYSSPTNPDTGAPGALPQLFDAAGKPIITSAADPSGPGNQGLQINTLRGKQVIQQVAPWATNIGGVRDDPLKWHPEGLALDVMTDPGHGNNDPASPEGLARGNELYAYLNAHKDELGIDYIMWQEKDHYNHLHVNFAASGYPTGPVPGMPLPGAADAAAADPFAASTSGSIPGMDTATGGPGPDWWNGPLPASNTESVRTRHLPKGYRPTRSRSQRMGIKAAAGPLNAPGQTTVPLTMAGLPVQDWAKQKDQLKNMAHQLYSRAGMPEGEWAAFDRLIEKESSWDPTAKNPRSTAYGLGQFLDTTDAQYGPRTDNPFVQLPRIFQYIRNRYHGSPSEALQFHNANNWYDRGGWLPPGQSHIANNTGKPELIVPWDKLKSFEAGGFFTGNVDRQWTPMHPGEEGWDDFVPGGDTVGKVKDPLRGQPRIPGSPYPGIGAAIFPHGPNQFRSPSAPPPQSPMPSLLPGMGPGGVPGIFRPPGFAYGGLFKQAAVAPGPLPPPRPRAPDARFIRPPQAPPPRPPFRPGRDPQDIMPPPMPPPTPSAPTAGPAVPQTQPTPDPTVTPVQIGPGPGAGANAATGGSHLNPAVQKGIRSGFQTAGNLASMAAGAAGIPGAGLIGGAFGQFGKIAENIANVGASFLVGTLTNGTTPNPYGATQRGAIPTGGTTTVVDRSVNMGDVTTQDPDYFFKQMDLRDAQSRAMLGRFG